MTRKQTKIQINTAIVTPATSVSGDSFQLDWRIHYKADSTKTQKKYKQMNYGFSTCIEHTGPLLFVRNTYEMIYMNNVIRYN